MGQRRDQVLLRDRRDSGRGILLRERHPEHFDAYKKHFIEGFEARFYNHRTGHIRVLDDEPWKARWQRAKARGDDLSFPGGARAADRIVEKHLSLEAWNRPAASGRTSAKPLGDYYWLGLYAGRTTRHLVYDLDNHGGGAWYRDEAGRRLPLAELPIRFLQDLGRLYHLPHPPDVLVTSSANLGLHAYVRFGSPHVTARVLDYFTTEMTGIGLDCEVYPNASNCLRRPFGYGSWTLSSRGILKSFAEQMDHYLDPSPLPPLEQVVEMLIDLWVDQHAHLAACLDPGQLRPWEPRVDVPARIAAMEAHVDRIRDWMAAGRPDRERAIAIAVPGSGKKKGAGDGTGQRWPEDCKPPRMSWLERVHRLASDGLWLPDTLNPALLDLATWLLAVELHNAGDREAVVERLLEVFCATRHNGFSDRLEGVERVEQLPGAVMTAISEAIASARGKIDRFAGAREKSYRKPLRVAFLLAGEGDPNACGNPGAVGDSDLMEREHCHPFIRGTLRVAHPSIEDLLDSGRLDEPLPDEIEAIIAGAVRSGDAPRFHRRLINYLVIRGGRARVHQERLLLLAGTPHLRQLQRFKRAGIEAGLFLASEDAVRLVQSTSYALTADVAEACGLGGCLSACSPAGSRSPEATLSLETTPTGG